ncbi:MarR family winged helix-turn-helix transcriptional regulator [Saccharothrix sp. Mg75]|uniref:MarR family winged helix-turn-helix transcriptional regulator n=1 Tax=Saccharothrix sp. Mg75 TaxID=3445357 RepID=UPI003EECE3CC
MSVERLRRHPSYLMLQLTKRARRISADLVDDGLRHIHVAVLWQLVDGGPASQRQISDRLGVDASDLVTLVDDLERLGLAARLRDARDRRRYSVHVTAAGERALRHRLELAEEVEDRLFAALDAAERAHLADLLVKSFLHHEQGRVVD